MPPRLRGNVTYRRTLELIAQHIMKTGKTLTE